MAQDYGTDTSAIDTCTNTDNVSAFEFAWAHQGPIERTLSGGCLVFASQPNRRVLPDAWPVMWQCARLLLASVYEPYHSAANLTAPL